MWKKTHLKLWKDNFFFLVLKNHNVFMKKHFICDFLIITFIIEICIKCLLHVTHVIECSIFQKVRHRRGGVLDQSSNENNLIHV